MHFGLSAVCSDKSIINSHLSFLIIISSIFFLGSVGTCFGLTADAGPDKIILSGLSTTLEGLASDGVPPYTYSWQPADGLDDPNIAQPTASPAQTTTYTLTVKDNLNDTANDNVTVTILEGFTKWPVRNGDFSIYQGWGRPAEWGPVTESGTLTFTADPTPTNAINPPSAAVIETVSAGGRGYYVQVLSLLRGDYRLQAEVSGTTGARVQVQVAGAGGVSSPEIDVNETWQSVELDLSDASGDIHIYLFSVNTGSAGTVKFRNIKLEARSLINTSAISCQGVGEVGGIVLSENPSLAERYACYELQRYLYKITRKMSGLKYRDEVHSGEFIYIGSAATQSKRDQLACLPEDSYMAGYDAEGISLVGNTDLGTLYAVYDFLRQQGCRWNMVVAEPAAGYPTSTAGEVIPPKLPLNCSELKIEIPDYELRGYELAGADFFPGGGWIFVNMDEHIDYAIRNGFNAVWSPGVAVVDFGKYRGHGWIQKTSHSWNSLLCAYDSEFPGDPLGRTYFEVHPEWYALVDGVRKGYSDGLPPWYFPTQFSVSNQQLRDHIVGLIVDYFNNNPLDRMFPLNPMDGPTYWCESAGDMALDPTLANCGLTLYLETDYNKDRYVNWKDLAHFTMQWLEKGYSNSYWSSRVDFDHNGQVNFKDFAIFTVDWFEYVEPKTLKIAPETALIDESQEEVNAGRTLAVNDWHYQHVSVDDRYLYAVEFRGIENGTVSSVTCEVWGTPSNNGPPTQLLGSVTETNVNKNGWVKFDFFPAIDLESTATGYYTSAYGSGRLIIALTSIPTGEDWLIALNTPGSTYPDISEYSPDQGQSFVPINSDFAFRVRADDLPYPGTDWSNNGYTNTWMTDRTLNFVNYITEQVTQVHPDKLIELCAYGYNRYPPARESVHPNIAIRYANVAGPLGLSLTYDERYTRHQEFHEHLQGWLNAGTRHLSHYHYGDFVHPDVSLCWFFNIVDTLKNLRDLYGNNGLLGEISVSVQSSAAWFNVLGKALWDNDIDYTVEIADFCTNFYGSAAADMNDYYSFMDQTIRSSDIWKQPSYHPNNHYEFTEADLTTAKSYLDSAAAAVSGVSPYEQRIAFVRFAHAYLTYVRTNNVQYKNEANNLRSTYNIMVKLPTSNQLQ